PPLITFSMTTRPTEPLRVEAPMMATDSGRRVPARLRIVMDRPRQSNGVVDVGVTLCRASRTCQHHEWMSGGVLAQPVHDLAGGHGARNPRHFPALAQQQHGGNAADAE